ncbi:transposase [Albidovulum sp.]|uniref:transposase n=1 Tax=Albidovulum sp. TaxID=1872424 RepID=UPI003D7E2F3A
MSGQDPRWNRGHGTTDAAHAREHDIGRRLRTIPGVGPMYAMAVEAVAPAMEGFARDRAFSTWLGLVSRQYSSDGKRRLGKSSKMRQRDIWPVAGQRCDVDHRLERTGGRKARLVAGTDGDDNRFGPQDCQDHRGNRDTEGCLQRSCGSSLLTISRQERR